jgi:hypothetical protein
VEQKGGSQASQYCFALQGVKVKFSSQNEVDKPLKINDVF